MIRILLDIWYLPFLFTSIFSGDEGWKINLSPNDIKGERIIVSGIIFDEDGKTPVEGIEVYVYHTGTDGIYGKGDDLIDGTMITNSKGQYEYHSIKPGAYPAGNNPAHVHYKITGKGYPEQWFELRFHGDKYLKESDYKKEEGKGAFSGIQKPGINEDKILIYKMDLRLKK